jgi:5-formyltetrahydrofolate cyclo-ligase
MTQTTDQSSNGANEVLRCSMRSRRRRIPKSTRIAYDESIRQHVLQFIEARHINSVAGFWPIDGEPDIIPLFKKLLARKKKIALPIVSGNNDHTMKFHLWQTDTVLRCNRYGICEPQDSAQVDLADFDLLLMPLVAWDRQGNRIGMGSGYYDRHLEKFRNSHSPLRLGIGYSMQELDLIRKNDWDIPLHAIVNEHGCLTFDNEILNSIKRRDE